MFKAAKLQNSQHTTMTLKKKQSTNGKDTHNKKGKSQPISTTKTSTQYKDANNSTFTTQINHLTTQNSYEDHNR